MLPNANNEFTITHYTAAVATETSEVQVTLDNAIHPAGKSVSVIANARGTNANMNVFVKSLSNSTGSWVITFGLSAVSDGTTETSIDYMVYSSVV